MSDYRDDAHDQQCSQLGTPSDHGFVADFVSMYCTKCFIKRLDVADFPEFFKKLLEVWREHNVLYREFVKADSWFVRMLPLVETSRFRIIHLPNGEWAELQLERAKSEFHLRRKPQLVFITPRRCSCRASGRRAAIDRFLDSPDENLTPHSHDTTISVTE
ncbi:hypothetical protein [Lacipirellula limnantheis]|uniref:Uncharacterized protein n=1 Tax=Lacipirellula limnantheis TaxID=2528024 RepID=A0A517TRF7_9BACT|nr:hypothetical protein [Lacipirellula limnantheis]QDT70961.1 hypothetical protein I41_01160 [Lacipirellula limnantheis]